MSPSTEKNIAASYHEFFETPGVPRRQYQFLWDNMKRGGLIDLAEKAREAQLALHASGVTFTVYSKNEEGIERVWPFDVVPRIIPACEWETLETGIRQRVKALNRFLNDVYHDQKILKDGVVPAWLIYEGKDFRREVVGVDPPNGIYTHISGVDLIRDEHGAYRVLEDNLRTPSGVSYMIENRVVERQILPEYFDRYRVRGVEHYPSLLLQALRRLSPRGNEAVIVILTPGIYNAAYFEHTFLAKEMGVLLAEGRDLVVKGNKVYLKTTSGLRQVDVVYRRVDDTFLDPLCFRTDSLVGVAGLINAWRSGNVAIVNAPGNGIADDKAVYAYVPDIIRYYLAEEPLLPNVPTFLLSKEEDRRYALAHLDQLVVKAVNESGGYGMLMGPSSTPEERADFARRIEENPRHFIAQPVVPLSQHECLLDGALQPRHLDLRPFVVYGEDIHVVPGGLTRVAFRKGSLVVNSSQGGGSKDTWVVEETPP